MTIFRTKIEEIKESFRKYFIQTDNIEALDKEINKILIEVNNYAVLDMHEKDGRLLKSNPELCNAKLADARIGTAVGDAIWRKKQQSVLPPWARLALERHSDIEYGRNVLPEAHHPFIIEEYSYGGNEITNIILNGEFKKVDKVPDKDDTVFEWDSRKYCLNTASYSPIISRSPDSLYFKLHSGSIAKILYPIYPHFTRNEDLLSSLWHKLEEFSSFVGSHAGEIEITIKRREQVRE